MDSLFANPLPGLTVCTAGLPEHNIEDVLDAIVSQRYATLYAALRKFQHTFSPVGAFQLIRQALEYELTYKAILAILERCPPVEEFLFSDRANTFPMDTHGLVELAAYLDRTDVLALLLERGGNVNRHPSFSLSPLEAALEGPALGSVELLARRPELDTGWTPRLRNLWSRQDPEPPKLEFCLQALVPRFFPGERSPLAPLPIPEGQDMTTLAIENGNWPLALRLLQERPPLSRRDAKTALAAFSARIPYEEQSGCIAALAALLEGCPGLLRSKKTCQVLLGFWLTLSQDCRPPLRPWVERIPFRQIDLPLQVWVCVGTENMLPRWDSLLPNGPALAVDRWSAMFESREPEHGGLSESLDLRLPLSITPEFLARILERCPILGKPKADKLSPLAKVLVQKGRPGQLESLLLPGGVLAGEPSRLLLACARDEGCPRHNRAAILSHIRKEETYDL